VLPMHHIQDDIYQQNVAIVRHTMIAEMLKLLCARKVNGFYMKTSVKQEASLNGKKSVWVRMASNWQLYVFLAPAMILLLIFSYFPMYGIILAFKEYLPSLGIMGSPWVGFDHFERFFNLPKFWTYIWNTVKVSALITIIDFPFPIILALMLHHANCRWYKKMVQNFTYLPYMLSLVIIINIAQVFCSPTGGVFNIIRGWFGGAPINFFGEDKYVFEIYWLTGLWQTLGYSAVIYMAALSGVDQEQLEAARIDGANQLRIIWSIELPAISNTVIILLILTVGRIFSVGADKMLLIQNSANLGASEILSTYVYKVGILDAQFGFSTAVNLFNTLVNIICLLLVNWVSSKVSETSLF